MAAFLNCIIFWVLFYFELQVEEKINKFKGSFMSLFLRCDNVMSSEGFEKSQKLNTKVAFIDDFSKT